MGGTKKPKKKHEGKLTHSSKGMSSKGVKHETNAKLKDKYDRVVNASKYRDSLENTHKDWSSISKIQPTDEEKFIKRNSVLVMHHGGVKSQSKANEVYFIGIIDILTEWRLNKKMEHAVLSISRDGHEISCV